VTKRTARTTAPESTPEPLEEYWSWRQVRSYFKISRRKLVNLNRDRVLTYHQLAHRKFVYPRSSVIKFLEAIKIPGQF
jgi:hypothetical protein